MAPAGLIDVKSVAVPAATEPAEARGLRRDEVRLLVSDVEADRIEHASFRDLPLWLRAGDVLVVNTSATLNAAVDAVDESGEAYEVHFSTPEPGGNPRMAEGYDDAMVGNRWIVEVRQHGFIASLPYRNGRRGQSFVLPAGGRLVLDAPRATDGDGRSRLWRASVTVPGSMLTYLEEHGRPIRYEYVPQEWPSAMYQTVFANEPGSAEMPSAGRAFTSELIVDLVARGIQIAPVLLHTGVSSLEDHEPPYEEYFRVGSLAAELVNAARRRGDRVIAVGTTAVRALETATDADGITSATEGWTDIVIGSSSRIRSVDGLITGLHEPRASHLAMLDRIVGDPHHLARAYAEARAGGYLWHEFGDTHLILQRQAGAGERLSNPDL